MQGGLETHGKRALQQMIARRDGIACWRFQFKLSVLSRGQALCTFAREQEDGGDVGYGMIND